jgi:hypothetical protein
MPSRAEVLEVINRLLAGDLTREEASRWAGPIHVDESPDSLIEDALDLLTLIDAWQTDAEGIRTGYLYDLRELARMRDVLVAALSNEHP